jgi:hypothetical protein
VSIFGKSEGHFRASIVIDPLARKRPAFNGIRWAFVYADDVEQLGAAEAPISDVWPEFLNVHGDSIPHGVPLIGQYNAVMHIIADHMVEVHFRRLELGTRFYCVEGRTRCAEGMVTSLDV